MWVFFRFGELESLRECDVFFYDEHAEVFVESSKTDQFREGTWVPIARTNSNICPVAMLERYFRLANIQGNADKLLFRGLTSTKQAYRLHPSGGISYTRVSEGVGPGKTTGGRFGTKVVWPSQP